MSVAQTGVATEQASPWQPLRFFNVYRLFIASSFFFLSRLSEPPPPLGRSDLHLFEQTAFIYLLFSLGTIYTLHRQQPRFLLQLYGMVFTDIVLITMLMYASGGVESGLGMLLVVSVAIGSMISAERIAGLFAALATLAVLLEESLSPLWRGDGLNFPQAGILGITLFATAALAHVLARRARVSEALAHQRELDLENMAQLTEHIIKRMLTGVVVVDPEQRVRLFNMAALDLLGAPANSQPESLEALSPPLQRCLEQWQHGGGQTPLIRPGTHGKRQLIPRVMGLGTSRREGALIFLEDAERTTRQAQQLKLISLGRLTAGIAHEIRNPLAAISHAGELLGESPQLGDGDRRLSEIIVNQSQRIDRIIKDVLQLGRRDHSRPELFLLDEQLEQFIDEFTQQQGLPGEALALEVIPPGLEVRFDRGHLLQILTNLCQNGLRHSPNPGPNGARLLLLGGIDSRQHPYLEVWDYGPGVSSEARPHLFEPFFTTESGGTGLGLYISRELSECNHAHLDYDHDGEYGRFRLTFANPQQQFE